MSFFAGAQVLVPAVGAVERRGPLAHAVLLFVDVLVGVVERVVQYCGGTLT
ncbi:hypothetical protein [Streptomyces sp. NPDC048057]|uniref:hypothetical protein n=1 Tax=Streptomyces sp. NPDC048057 TaxID=3155628 RepID=UPI0033DE4CE8